MSDTGVSIEVVICGRLAGILQEALPVGVKSYIKTIVIRTDMISLVARCLPGQTEAPLPNDRYAEAGTRVWLSPNLSKNRRGSNWENEDPHTSALLWSSADGISKMESFLKKY